MITKKDDYVEEIQYLIDSVPGRELLELLAEEAAELSQAALKMIRVMYSNETNPTNISYVQAQKNLIEEYSDVSLMWYLLGLQNPVKPWENPKVKRWVERIEHAQ